MLHTRNQDPLAIILSVSGLNDKAYIAEPSIILSMVEICPLCEVRVLARDGGYARWIPVGLGRLHGWIYRKYCRSCDVSFSLIPDFILRGHSFGRMLVVSWLWAWLHGASVRDRAFYEDHGIAPATTDPYLSWSDLLDVERTRPGYQQLWRWARQFSRRAHQWMALLVETCIALGIDHELQIALRVGCLEVGRRGRSLAQAAALLAAIQFRNLDLGDATPLTLSAVDALVPFLMRRPLAASHKARRAAGHTLGYDCLAVSGLSPPARPSQGAWNGSTVRCRSRERDSARALFRHCAAGGPESQSSRVSG